MKPQMASVILPVYNQADHIEEVLTSILDGVQRLDFPCELLAVVNGCQRDRSWEVCQAVAEQHASVRALRIEEGGWGRAVRFGLSQARGDLLCYTNSARVQARELVLMLLYGSAYDDTVLAASRKIRSSFMRRMGSLFYNLECRALFDLPYWDVNGTPKVFHRRMGRLLELQRTDDLIDLEFNVVCRAQGYTVLEVPIFSSSRHSGKSTTNLRSAVRMYVGAWRMRRELPGK